MILDGRRLARGLFVGQVGQTEYLERFGYQPPPVDRVADITPVPAEVHHGIWIARCSCGADGLPAPGSVVWLAQPLMWCPRCSNAAVGGAWWPVALPREWRAIERVLAARPDTATRNWLPGETLADLKRENAEHNVGRAA